MCGGSYNRTAIISRWLCQLAQMPAPGLPAAALEDILPGLCAICGASFEGLAAEPARLAYSAHWRADNENPGLTSVLKFLGERYPLPAVGG
jgi:hypothetical protein